MKRTSNRNIVPCSSKRLRTLHGYTRTTDGAIQQQEQSSKLAQHQVMQDPDLIRFMFAFMDIRDHQHIRATCRAWKRILSSMTINTVDLSQHSPLTARNIDRALLGVTKTYRFVRHLDFTGQRMLNDHDMLVLSSHFWPSLESLCLDDCLDLTDHGLRLVLNARSLKLRSISMKHCKMVGESIRQGQIHGRHPQLQIIDLDDTRVEYAFVNGLERYFPSLHTIRATHTPAHHTMLSSTLDVQSLLDQLQRSIEDQTIDSELIEALVTDYNRYVSRWKAYKTTCVSVFQKTLLADGPKALFNAPLNARDQVSAVLFACKRALVRSLSVLLVTQMIDVEVTNNHGSSPLYLAAERGLPRMVRMLLLANANVHQRSHCLATPLHIACEMNWTNLVPMLLKCGADPSVAVLGGSTPLCTAAKNGHRQIIRNLIDYAANYYLGNGPRPCQVSAEVLRAIFLACESGFVDIVSDLLRWTNMHVDTLLNDSISLLYLASQIGHLDLVKLFLSKRANPNFHRAEGVSCLYIAAQEGHVGVVKYLLMAGADPDARMADDATALHIAARMGNLDVAITLLDHGANIDAQTRSGLSPLYIASEEGHTAMIGLFIEKRSNVDLQTANGTTALFVASQRGHLIGVHALLAAGANGNIAKANGTYPMDIAMFMGYHDVMNLLLQYGAHIGGLSLHFAEARNDRSLHFELMQRYYNQHRDDANMAARR